MNSQVQVIAIAGLTVMLTIPAVIIAIALVWGHRIHIPKYSFWIAAAMGVIFIFPYLLLVVGPPDNSEPGRLIGGAAAYVIFALIAQVIFFLGAFIRQAFVDSTRP